jgi:tetratricopeptide (TPR) repeat protein
MQSNFEELKHHADNNFNEKKYDLALKQYSKAISLDFNDDKYKIYMNRCLTLFKLDRFEEALEDAIKATELNPSYSKAWGRLGSCLTALKRKDEAKIAYTRALQLDSDNILFKKILEEKEEKEEKDMNIDELMNKMKQTKINDDFDFPIEGLMGNLFKKMRKNEKFLKLAFDEEFQKKLQIYKNNPLAAMNNPDMMDLVKDVIKELK